MNQNPPNNYPEIHINNALEISPEVKFLEQSFDWKNMIYEFYPYYWGRKENWLESYPLKDNDPLFADFYGQVQHGYWCLYELKRLKPFYFISLQEKCGQAVICPSLTPQILWELL